MRVYNNSESYLRHIKACHHVKSTSPPEDIALLPSLFDVPASRASDALAAWDIDKQPESSTSPVNRPVRNTSDKCVDSKAQIPSVYGKQ